MFKIDEKLAKDCFFIKDLSLSKLLLMNDANYLWFILVPRKENLVELIDLNFEEQKQLLEEINKISKILKSEFKVDKINIATLGNVVKQLHIHVIGRFKNDIAFPKPVWGFASEKPFSNADKEKIFSKIHNRIF
jgi:diadenosine tetraphosphate (Ap4A) HIT family hydrolase